MINLFYFNYSGGNYMSLSFKRKAVMFTYHHPNIFKKISTLRLSLLDLKKILK